MENKLLFGDIVRHKSDKNKTYGVELENEEYLELISYLNTARLNCLEKTILKENEMTPEQIKKEKQAFEEWFNAQSAKYLDFKWEFQRSDVWVGWMAAKEHAAELAINNKETIK